MFRLSGGAGVCVGVCAQIAIPKIRINGTEARAIASSGLADLKYLPLSSKLFSTRPRAYLFRISIEPCLDLILINLLRGRLVTSGGGVNEFDSRRKSWRVQILLYANDRFCGRESPNRQYEDFRDRCRCTANIYS